MKVYTNIEDFKDVKNPVVTTGTFDGVHLGHQKIISRLKDVAQQEQGETEAHSSGAAEAVHAAAAAPGTDYLH